MIKGLMLIIAIALVYSSAYADSNNPICKDTPNGTVKDYYPNGKLKTEWNCKEGHLNGLTKLYYENGNLEKETSYVNDVRQGVTTGYYESGELKSVCNYKDGELDGVHKILYPAGLIKELRRYHNFIDLSLPQTRFQAIFQPTPYFGCYKLLFSKPAGEIEHHSICKNEFLTLGTRINMTLQLLDSFVIQPGFYISDYFLNNIFAHYRIHYCLHS